MIALLNAEFRKLARSLPFFVALAIILFVMIVCWLTDTGANRFANQLGYMPFCFLISSCLLVGGVCAIEYDNHTLKELIMANGRRSYIYITKLIIVIAASVVLFALYALILIISSSASVASFGWQAMSVQALALLQHVFVLFNLAIVLQSFSALGVSTIVFLLVYREASLADPATPIGRLLSHTFLAQFANIESADGVTAAFLACLSVAVVSCTTGYLVFRAQDVK